MWSLEIICMFLIELIPINLSMEANFKISIHLHNISLNPLHTIPHMYSCCTCRVAGPKHCGEQSCTFIAPFMWFWHGADTQPLLFMMHYPFQDWQQLYLHLLFQRETLSEKCMQPCLHTPRNVQRPAQTEQTILLSPLPLFCLCCCPRSFLAGL